MVSISINSSSGVVLWSSTFSKKKTGSSLAGFVTKKESPFKEI
jgi:hypothetical protein